MIQIGIRVTAQAVDGTDATRSHPDILPVRTVDNPTLSMIRVLLSDPEGVEELCAGMNIPGTV